MHPGQGSNPPPRYVPLPRIKPQTSPCMGWCSDQLSYTGQGMQTFLLRGNSTLREQIFDIVLKFKYRLTFRARKAITLPSETRAMKRSWFLQQNISVGGGKNKHSTTAFLATFCHQVKKEIFGFWNYRQKTSDLYILCLVALTPPIEEQRSSLRYQPNLKDQANWLSFEREKSSWWRLGTGLAPAGLGVPRTEPGPHSLILAFSCWA